MKCSRFLELGNIRIQLSDTFFRTNLKIFSDKSENFPPLPSCCRRCPPSPPPHCCHRCPPYICLSHCICLQNCFFHFIFSDPGVLGVRSIVPFFLQCVQSSLSQNGGAYLCSPCSGQFLNVLKWWVELPQLVPEIFGNAQRYFEARYRNSDARYRYFEVRYQYFEARYRFSDLSPLSICNFFTSQNSYLKGCMVPLFAFVWFTPLCVLKCFLAI